MRIGHLVIFALLSGTPVMISTPVQAQQPAASSSTVEPSTTPASPIRIWISDKQVASAHGSVSSSDILKELNEKCTNVVLTDDVTRADYRLEAGFAWCCTQHGESRGYKFAVFNKDGDAVFSTKTHTLANAVKDVCNSIGRAKLK